MSCKIIILSILLSISGFLITEPANSIPVESFAISDDDENKEYDDYDYDDDGYEDEEYDDDDEYEDDEYDDKEESSIIKENCPEQEKMLVAHYKFEGDLKDSSDNKNDGSIAHGDISFDKGKNGKAAMFDGESYIEVEDNDSLNLDEAFTISVWLNKSDDEEYSYYPILAKGIGSETVDPPYILFLDSTKPGLMLHIEDYWDSLSINDSSDEKFDQWYMITVTFDSNTEKVDFYINGAFIGYKRWEKGALYNTDQNLYIGFGDIYAEQEFFIGLMDELRIYNYALTDKEIKALYNETVPEQKVYTSIVITPTKMAIMKAESTLNFNVIGVMKDGKKENINKSATYQSSNNKIVTVSKEGKVKTLGKGKATVTVSNGKLKKVLIIIVK